MSLTRRNGDFGVRQLVSQRFTRDEVERFYRQGVISQRVFEHYMDRWYMAPRFGSAPSVQSAPRLARAKKWLARAKSKGKAAPWVMRWAKGNPKRKRGNPLTRGEVAKLVRAARSQLRRVRAKGTNAGAKREAYGRASGLVHAVDVVGSRKGIWTRGWPKISRGEIAMASALAKAFTKAHNPKRKNPLTRAESAKVLRWGKQQAKNARGASKRAVAMYYAGSATAAQLIAHQMGAHKGKRAVVGARLYRKLWKTNPSFRVAPATTALGRRVGYRVLDAAGRQVYYTFRTKKAATSAARRAGRKRNPAPKRKPSWGARGAIRKVFRVTSSGKSRHTSYGRRGFKRRARHSNPLLQIVGKRLLGNPIPRSASYCVVETDAIGRKTRLASTFSSKRVAAKQLKALRKAFPGLRYSLGYGKGNPRKSVKASPVRRKNMTSKRLHRLASKAWARSERHGGFLTDIGDTAAGKAARLRVRASKPRWTKAAWEKKLRRDAYRPTRKRVKRARKKNPLTRKETAQVLKTARRAAKRERFARSIGDPRERSHALGHARGTIDTLLGVASDFGSRSPTPAQRKRWWTYRTATEGKRAPVVRFYRNANPPPATRSRAKPGQRIVSARQLTLAEARKAPGFAAAMKGYRRFHAAAPVEAQIVRINDGSKAVTRRTVYVMGQAPTVTYQTLPGQKSNKAGRNGKKITWEHRMGEGGGQKPLLVHDPRSGVTSYIGGSYRVTTWMHK